VKEAMENLKPACFGTPKDRRHERRIIYWTLAWMVLFVGSALADEYGWIARGVPAVLLALASIVPAVGIVRSYIRLLREGDELRRKIELEALAVAFGVGVFGGLTYALVGEAGGLPEAGVAELVMSMVLTYLVAVLVGRWRYA
jgi:hypothetical protein